MQEEIIGVIPQDDQKTVLEVALLHDESGRSTMELRYLIWGGAELGWYRQQTLAVKATAVRQLFHSLGIAQCRLGQMVATDPKSNVIPFPRDRRTHGNTAQPSTADAPVRTHTLMTGTQD